MTRRAALALGATLGLVIAASVLDPPSAAAHSFERAFPLPVPLWLYLSGAGAAVGVSFVAAAAVGRPPGAVPRYPQVALPAGLADLAGVVLSLIGLAGWLTAMIAGLTGNIHEFLPAVLLWILIWVGIPIACVTIGNPWPSLSPFRTIFRLADAIGRVAGLRTIDAGWPYPKPLARWPAVALLALALCFEFVIPGGFSGDTVGQLMLVYTGVTLVGMTLFGPSAWLRNAELLEVLFGWFGRIGPVGRLAARRELCEGCPEACAPERCIDCPDCTVTARRGDQRAVLRPWFAGLTEVQGAGWSDAAFILLALAGVSYDGLRETTAWGAVVSLLFDPLATALGALYAIIAVDAVGLIGMWLLFVGAFALAATVTRWLSGSTRPLPALAGSYAATLLPIAAGYLLAHYFSLVIQAVLWLPGLFSDPLSFAPELDWLAPEVIWYVSVGAIVVGHVAGVILAHRLALREGVARATLGGVPLVLLMIGYTVFSLWIIAQPLTDEPL